MRLHRPSSLPPDSLSRQRDVADMPYRTTHAHQSNPPNLDLNRVSSSLKATGLPHHRTIVALDIESSTSRPDSVKAELRNKIYELFDEALSLAGIHGRHRDPFIDRGDGLLALIHPVDVAPKVLLLSPVIPSSNRLLADYNTNLRPRADLNDGCGSASSCTPGKSTTTPTDASARHSISRSACSMPPG